MLILGELFDAEKMIAYGWSDDFDRYTKMGLRLAPNDPVFLQRNRNLKEFFSSIFSFTQEMCELFYPLNI